MGVAVRWEAWKMAGAAVVLAAPLSPITFPAVPLTFRVEIALGADPAADPATWSWLDITEWVRYSDGIQITRGRPDETGTVDPGKARLRLDNRDGRFSRRNPNGPYYGLLSKNTPIRIGANPGDGVHYRFHGFINEWPARWSPGLIDSSVPIVAAGVLRRLSKTGQTLSAARRAFTVGSLSDGLIAYWPIEDGKDAPQAASAVDGVGPLTFSPWALPGALDQPQAGSLPYAIENGSVTNPAFTAGAAAFADFKLPASTAGFFAFTAALKGTMPLPSTARAVINTAATITFTGGDISQVRLNTYNRWTGSAFDFANTGVDVLLTGGTSYGSVAGGASVSMFDGNPHDVHLRLDQVGADVVCELWVDGVMVDTSTSAGKTLGTPYQLIGPFSASGTLGGTTVDNNDTTLGFGHYAVHASAAPAVTATDVHAAFIAHVSEQAHIRMIRNSDEENVPFYNTSAVSAAMGPQQPGTYLDTMRTCESADMGVLYEHEFGLGYQSLDDRLNVPVQLALDFDAGHIAETPEPADDDQRLTNRVTATRTGGSSATVRDDASIAEHGLFETSATVDVQADHQAGDVAGWRVWRGIVEEDRWPSIAFRLDANPDLIPAWTALPFGARMTVANPPDEMPPDTLDLIVDGWSERLDQFTWTADLNLSPASPYQVGVLSAGSGDTGQFVGHLEADSVVLFVNVSTTDVTWQVIPTPGWTTVADDFPMNVRWGGEEIKITACADAGGGVFNWTVVRSINGVIKAHTDPIGYQGLTQPLIVVP